MASSEPLSIDKMLDLFTEDKEPPTRDALKEALDSIEAENAARGVELKKVSSGYRFQAKKDFSPWVSRLWEEKPARYSRALLETLVLIAYKQPITRGEIEHVRGVAVSSQIIKTLLEREWVRVVGHRDVPGKPALYATTKAFLDYFNLNSLDELPTLAEIRDLDKINPELELREPGLEPEDITGESAAAEESHQQKPAADDALPPSSETANDIPEEQALSAASYEGNTFADISGEVITDEEIDTNRDDRDDVMLAAAAEESVVDDEAVLETAAVDSDDDYGGAENFDSRFGG
jgi:segregation and condensation protein B